MSVVEQVQQLEAHASGLIIGQSHLINRMLIALLCDGHLLVEGAPGLAKTRAIKVLAESIEGDFHRLQFTPDLLPADLTGTDIYRPQEGTFEFRKGPLFHNLILADEINRAPAKVQSALLEAMAESSVSVDGVTHSLSLPHFVVATQNPLEHHGVHPLPESQLDRFLVRLSIGYPDPEDEAAVLRDDPAVSELPRLEAVVTGADVLRLQRAANAVKFDETIVAYLLSIVADTREHEALEIGVSPRGAIAMRRAAQARALVDGRDYCIPEDVRELAVDVFAHRVTVDPRSQRARAIEETPWIIREILDSIPIPL